MESTAPYSPQARAIAIILRTSHIASMAVLVGGIQLAVSGPQLQTWRALTIATGLGLLLTEMRHSRHWVYQGRGLMTLAHLGVLGLILVSPAFAQPAVMAALAIGSIGSHLPRKVRKWSLRHRRIVDDGRA